MNRFIPVLLMLITVAMSIGTISLLVTMEFGKAFVVFVVGFFLLLFVGSLEKKDK